MRLLNLNSGQVYPYDWVQSAKFDTITIWRYPRLQCIKGFHPYNQILNLLIFVTIIPKFVDLACAAFCTI